MATCRTSLLSSLEQKCKLPPEVEEGNVEYKLKIQPGNEYRKTQLTSQLQWRLTEHGECYYMLGVDDDGTILGIYLDELEDSIKSLQDMCSSIDATITSIEKRRVNRRPELYAAEICVRLKSTTTSPISVRRMVKIAFVGDSEAGKSTLLGVLTTGQLDNGDGSIRLSMLRHRHELLSGRTSSVAIEFLPFDTETKQPIRLEMLESSMEPISLTKQKQLLGTARVAQLLDLAGNVRYQKTTYSALTSWAAPDWICVVISSSVKSLDSCNDLLSLIIGLELPFFVVINKMDLVPTEPSFNLVSEIANLIVDVRKRLFGQTIPPYAVSIMKISCVNGEGIENLTNSLFRLHQRHNLQLLGHLTGSERFADCSMIFCIEGVQTVPDVGIIISGSIVYGALEHLGGNKQLTMGFLGPMKGGILKSIKIKSAHRMRLTVSSISSGQLVTLAIEGEDLDENQIQKGMILIAYQNNNIRGKDSIPEPLTMIKRIEADVVGCTSEQAGSIKEPIMGQLYWMGSRWAAKLLSIQTFYSEPKLRAIFELCGENEAFLLPGTRIIFVCPHLRLQGLVNKN